MDDNDDDDENEGEQNSDEYEDDNEFSSVVSKNRRRDKVRRARRLPIHFRLGLSTSFRRKVKVNRRNQVGLSSIALDLHDTPSPGREVTVDVTTIFKKPKRKS